MTDVRDTLFNNAMGDSNTYDSIYNGWPDELISAAMITNRTVVYDSNIAFTNGDGPVAGMNAKAVPNLYETLNGFNKRVNGIDDRLTSSDLLLHLKAQLDTSGTSVALYATSTESTSRGKERNISGDIQDAVNKYFESLDLRLVHMNGTAITISGDDIVFTFPKRGSEEGQSYTMTDIFKMIEELDARTRIFKTNAIRNDIGDKYNADDKTELEDNTIKITTPIKPARIKDGSV